jgi:serine/threonine-protein kinase
MLTGEVPFTAESQVGVAMKHVREPLPDVQKLRPEVSAALAAVIEKATAKQRRNRYASAADMVADLEQALAIEAARAGGHTNGEATSILNALPTGTVDFPHPRRRRWAVYSLIALIVLAVAAAAVLVVVRASDNGPRKPAKPTAAPLRAARVIGATDFDPFADGAEHPTDVRNVFDGDPATLWSTEHYNDAKLPKPGVGIYIWTSSPVPARRIEVTSPTSGFSARVYGSNSIPSELEGWGKPLGRLRGGSRLRATLPGQRFSHYLVWITSLPPQGQVDISSIRVFY